MLCVYWQKMGIENRAGGNEGAEGICPPPPHTHTHSVTMNGVKVTVWDLSQMFQKWKKIVTLGFAENGIFTHKEDMEK